ncbi:MAG: molybdate ABC transporter substrate-binding protein [Chloroflexaceae bacterium]|nr:molybdate ABC transporter substrate-binding protein [Chloroflexaceae bacterium]
MSPRRQPELTIELTLLGLLHEQPLHGYELYQRLFAPEALGEIWSVKQSQFYAMLNRLAEAGYLTITQEQPGNYPPRKMLHLTAAGEQAFADWLESTAVEEDHLQRDLLARLYFASLAGHESVVALIDRQRRALQVFRGQAQQRQQAVAPHSYRWLVWQWRQHLVGTLLDWLDTFTLPMSVNTPIVYPIAALADSPCSALAEQFVAYVCSTAGQQVLSAHGFLGTEPKMTGSVVPAAPVDCPMGSEQVLTVFAAASLTDAFRELGTTFAGLYPGVQVRFTFAGSHFLARQLLSGVSADVFASANGMALEQVVRHGRIAPGTAHVFARNRLAVVTARHNPAHLWNLCDLAKPGRRLVFGSDSTAVGHYALEMIAQVEQVGCLGNTGKLAVLQNVIGYEETPQAVLNRVIAGEADAGIVFASDCVAAADQVLSPILYPMIVNQR